MGVDARGDAASSWVDYDNDGDLDRSACATRPICLHNDGDRF
jgi:hypothetical protein